MDFLKGLFYYKDGKVFNKVRRGSTALKDTEAGYSRKDGYRGILVKRKEWLTHRVVFYLHHGYMPDRIDHIDQNPANNRIDNLRSTTNSGNCANGRLRKNNKTGYKGVSKDPNCNRYRATCGNAYLGLFETPEQAATAYNDAAIRKYGEFASLNDIG